MAIAGAVVTLGNDGDVAFQFGLVKPEDAPEKPAKGKAASGDEGQGVALFSAALIESLTAHRSAALNAAFLVCPTVALAATVHAMALQAFYHGSRYDTVLQITASTASLYRVEGSAAAAAIGAAEEQWAERIPGNPDQLFAWCLDQPQERLIELLAFCAAQTVNATVLKQDRDATARLQHAALLADAVKLDMAAWFQPTAANYFAKVSKAQIIEALREVKGAVAPAWSSMKKAELAALAEREVVGTAWLPEPLRAPAPEA